MTADEKLAEIVAEHFAEGIDLPYVRDEIKDAAGEFAAWALEQFKLRLAEKYDKRGPMRLLDTYETAMLDCRDVYQALAREIGGGSK